MENNKSKIEEFDIAKTAETGLKEYHEFFMELLSEVRPDDPPRPYDKFKQQLLNVAADIKYKRWFIRVKGKIASYGLLILYLEGENTHIVDADIYTLPEYRKRGLAKQMLKKLYDYCREHDLTIMEFSTFSTTPAGSLFLKKIAAKLSKKENVYQLQLENVSDQLLRNWISRAQIRASDYQLEFWENETSREKLTDYVELYNDFVNSEPTGTLDYAEEDFDVEHIQDEIAVNQKRGWKHWILLARHIRTGKLTGFTEVIYTGFDKTLILQYGTGVLKDHRNKGLGRWLKANMIKLIRQKLPSVKRIRSHNATTNKAMTRINEELGFKIQYFEEYWHIDTEKVGECLKKYNWS